MKIPEIEPFVPWEEIEQHPDFLNLDDDVQLTVKTNWFKKEVESSSQWESLPDHKKRVALRNFLGTRLPTPAQESLGHPHPEMTASFMIAGGAAALPRAAIAGGAALPAFLKGAGEVGLTLQMMEKGYEVGAWAGGKLTNENEWGRLIGGSLVAGLLPIGAYTLARSLVAKEMYPKGAQDTPRAWQKAYDNEIRRIKKLLARPWEEIKLLRGKGKFKKGPDGKPQPVEPDEPSWDDLIKKYGSVDKMFEAEGGMANTARKYRAAYDWLNKQRNRGDTGYQSQAQARAEREAARETSRKADEEYWQKRTAKNEEVADKIKKAAQARRASGESKPHDREYALTVVEDALPVSAKMEKSLAGRQGTKQVSISQEPTATFLGWQEVPGKEPLALYNVEGGRLNKSTVTAKTLEKEGIAIPETPAKEKVKLPERHRSYLPMLLDEVREGGPPETLKFEGEYGHIEYRRTGSTYPEWMKNQGWTGKEVAIALQKGMKGEKLGPRQEIIFNSALSEARDRFLRDAKEHGRMRKEAIEEAKANGIKERDLQTSIQREAAEEIAREAEFAKAEREAIQQESIALSEEDISFKSEEIEPAKKPALIGPKHSKLMPYTKRADTANQILMDKNGVVYEGRGEEHVEILKHFNLKPEDITNAGMINMHGNYVWKGVEGRIEDYRRLWKDALARRERGEPEVLKEKRGIAGIKEEQASLIKEEAPFELTREQAPPKTLGPQHKKAVFPTENIPTGTTGKQRGITKEFEETKKGEPYAMFEFLGMQQIWEGIKTVFTETKPTTQEIGAPVQAIADQIKSLFKRYYGLNPEMKKRFTAIEESKEIIEDATLDQIFNKGLPGLTKQEATALTWHRSNPTKYPVPKGRNREAEFINQTLEFAMQALNKRELAMRWPDTAINRIQIKIDELEQEIKVMVNKKAIAAKQETVNDLRSTIEELRKRRYVPHIAVPSMTRKIMGFIDNVYPGKWKARRGEKLSSQVKRFLGRQTLSLEEFVAATKEKGVEAELDVRVLLADYLNYTIDKCIIYDEVERLKNIPDLILPIEEMPSDWKAIKGIKQLYGYGAHPFLADAIIEFTAEYPTRNLLLKGYDSINRLGKFIVFYNPMIMTVNDISQIYLGGGLTSKEMGKTLMGFAKPQLDTAVRDVITSSPLMRESQKLGLFSSPWHGRPSMIDMARMWAAHVESTKPEWHKALEKSVGKEIDFEKWLNPIIAGKDFYDTAFKVTWTLDRIWRMTQVRNLMEKGMSLPDAVERTRKLMVQYDYLPNRTRVFLNRIFLTPTYRVGMLRLYGNLARHPMEKTALPYKGVPKEEVPFEERMEKEAKPEDFTRENMKSLGRYALLKFLIYAGGPLIGYTWLESYRMIKRKETGEEEVFTLPGPMFELEKLFGRAWTNSLYLNLARIPYIMVSLKKNKDWKGEKIIDWGAPKHVIGGKISWYLTKTYLAPLERFEMLSGDEQDAMGKVLSFLAVSKYTRQNPHSWRGYQIYKANREYIEYINPRKSSGIIDEKRRPSAMNQVLAYEKWKKRLENINKEFEKRQDKLSNPFKENLFWKIFSGQPSEV